MKTFFATVLSFTLFALVAAQEEDAFQTLIDRGNRFATDPEALLRARALRQDVINQGGCNLNVCFAIDLSNSVSEIDFIFQREFVQFILAIAGASGSEDTENTAFAAASYGLSIREISPLTNDVEALLLKIDEAEFITAPTSFLAAPIGYCGQELRARQEDVNKMVLFTDGRSNFGGNPVPIARSLRRRDGINICAVGIGFQDNLVLRQITGDRNLVLELDSFFELLDILEALVAQVCSLETSS